MKMNLIALGVLSVTSGAALAQSNITLYGQVGAVVRYSTQDANATSVGNRVEVGNNTWGQSLWGIRGSEDLGGGLKANFVLESGFATDTGTSAAFGTSQPLFGRQAWVGLSGNWGALTLGRQFTAATERAIFTLDPTNLRGNASIAPLALFGANAFTNDTRANNTLKYRLNAGALSVGASYTAGETGTSNKPSSGQSLDVAYTTPAFALGAAYGESVDTTGNRKHTVMLAGGNVAIGQATRVYAAVAKTSLDAATAGAPKEEHTMPWLGVVQRFSPQTTLTVAYYRDKATALGNTAARDGTKQTGVIVLDYALSKRTSVYGLVDYNKFASGYMNHALNRAALGWNGSSSTIKGVSVGVRHTF